MPAAPIWEQRWPLPLRWACYVAGILLVLNGLGTGDSAFIYFQF